MADDYISLREFASDFFWSLPEELSRFHGIVFYWSVMLWFVLWPSHSYTTDLPPADVPNWHRGFWGILFAGAWCLLLVAIGYAGIWKERAADRSPVARCLMGL